MAKGESMKIIEMAKDIKPGEKVLDTGTSFVVKKRSGSENGNTWITKEE